MTRSVSLASAVGTGFFRNRLINGAFSVDQRNAGASQTITAGAALAYTVDRWYAYCTGANVTGQRVQGASANRYRYQFTGAASVTAIGFAQRIEAQNSVDFAGQIATLSVELANSLLSTVNWTAYYANTTDAFGTLASPTRTQIASGSFNVTSTASRYYTQISIPSNATSGIEIVFSVGAQTSGTWLIGEPQLELGSVDTPFERRQYGEVLSLCRRYYEQSDNLSSYAGAPTVIAGAVGFTQGIQFMVQKRVAPTVTIYNRAGTSGKLSAVSNGAAVGTTVSAANISTMRCQSLIDSGSGLTAGAIYEANYTASAEL